MVRGPNRSEQKKALPKRPEIRPERYEGRVNGVDTFGKLDVEYEEGHCDCEDPIDECFQPCRCHQELIIHESPLRQHRLPFGRPFLLQSN